MLVFLILVLRRLGQKDLEFGASLDNLVRLYLKKPEKQRRQEGKKREGKLAWTHIQLEHNYFLISMGF